MSRLAETQGTFARAMLHGDRSAIPSAFQDGVSHPTRLDIHLRHYRSSLTSALLQKFPATCWVLGDAFLSQAAHEFIRSHPPSAPCIAEYGGDFPEFLGQLEALSSRPYIEPLSRLDWLLGKVAIAVDEHPLAWSQISALGSELLLHSHLELQPGLRLLRAHHAVDELIELYLSGTEPDRFSLSQGETLIEIRGARGNVSCTRLDPGQFTFLQSLSLGSNIGDAAADAMEANSAFDPGAALRALVASESIVRISTGRSRP